MADSFFGFNTTLPRLSSAEIARFSNPSVTQHGEILNRDAETFGSLDSQVKDYALTHSGNDDLEIYDFGGGYSQVEALEGEHNLIVPEDTGDDLNDETFGGLGPVAKDFDFASQTANFTSKISEEEAFFATKQKPQSTNSGITVEEFYKQKSRAIQPPRVQQSTHSVEDLWKQEILPKKQQQADIQTAPSIWGAFAASNSPAKEPFDGYTSTIPSFDSRFTSGGPLHATPSGLVQGFHQQHQHGQPKSLEEIEAELQRQASRGYHTGPPQQPATQPPGKMLSVAEVEAALMNTSLANRSAPSHNIYRTPPPGYSPDSTALRNQREVMDAMSVERERKRMEKFRKMQEMARYNNLMTQQDKEFINRLQLQQLASDDPYSDDFYYQVYSTIRQRIGLPATAVLGNDRIQFARGGKGGYNQQGRSREENAMLRMQQQVQRIVSDARRKPKQTQLTLEGALGKITLHSVRNPRQLLQVSNKPAEPAPQVERKQVSTPSVTTSTYDRRKVLRMVEDIYTAVLHLEQLRRQPPPAIPRPGHDEEDEETRRAWEEEHAYHSQIMWEKLRVTEPIGVSYPHPFVAILSIFKGKKVIPRIARHVGPDQMLTMLTMLVANFESLDVCRAPHISVFAEDDKLEHEPDQHQEEIDLFMNNVMPPMLGFIAEAPFRIVIGLMKLFLERNNVAWVGRSKAGLVLLTSFLSRAETLKQGGGLHGLPPTSEQELQQWHELYTHLFSAMQGHYLSIFPPEKLDAMNQNAVDDLYAWQFLAAMAVGASIEQQHVLVTEVRERVLDNVFQASNNRLSPEKASQKTQTVNLFLHALGLDASQVSVPQQ